MGSFRCFECTVVRGGCVGLGFFGLSTIVIFCVLIGTDVMHIEGGGVNGGGFNLM